MRTRLQQPAGRRWAPRIAIGTALATLLTAALVTVAGPAHAAPLTPTFGPTIEGYEAAQGQSTCDGSEKPGPVDLRALLNRTYGMNRTGGITRACNDGGQSEHKEGRALDFAMNAFNSNELAVGNEIANWLLGSDSYGNAAANFRRLGLMYIIWNRRIWQPSTGWVAYSGESPHTDHMHFSFSWNGAWRQHSWWNGATMGLPRKLGDYNGDNRGDLGIWRQRTSSWYTRTPNGTVHADNLQFGLTGDVPQVGDVDGDNRDDYIVWRPTNGNWYVRTASGSYYNPIAWGLPGDIPLMADFNGDGRDDYVIYRPSSGTWWVQYSSGGTNANVQWGLPGDVPLAADVNGDGAADFLVWRPSTGGWWIKYTSGGVTNDLRWGVPGDIPMVGEANGDGHADFIVWRPSDGTWWVRYQSGGTNTVGQWGFYGDAPFVGDVNNDGLLDFAVWRASSGSWFIKYSSGGSLQNVPWGLYGDLPV